MMMVNGPESMEMHPEGSAGEMNSGIVMQRDEGTQQIISPTTTISTIVVQSGDTRVVIALLQVRNHLFFTFFDSAASDWIINFTREICKIKQKIFFCLI